LILIVTNQIQGKTEVELIKKDILFQFHSSINTHILLKPKTLHEVNNITKYFMVFIIKDAALYNSVLFHRSLIQHKSYPFLH